MKRIIILVLLVFCILGCTPSAEEKKYPVMPQDLSDCKTYHISDGAGDHITVMRCPCSSTTTQFKSGKTMKNVVVIDEQGCQEQ